MKKLLAVAALLLTTSVAQADINWAVYVTKNGDQNSTYQVDLATGETHVELPGIPVKVTVRSTQQIQDKEGNNIQVRMLDVEFLDGSGVAVGTFCPEAMPAGRGNSNSILVHRQFSLFEILLGCLQIPEAKQ